MARVEEGETPREGLQSSSVFVERKKIVSFACYALRCKQTFPSHASSKAHFLSSHRPFEVECGEPACTDQELESFCQNIEFLTQSRLNSKATSLKGAKFSLFIKETVALAFMKSLYDTDGGTRYFFLFLSGLR